MEEFESPNPEDFDPQAEDSEQVEKDPDLIVKIDDLQILAKDTDEEKHAKIQKATGLSKQDFVDAIFGWIKENTHKLADQFFYIVPDKDYTKMTESKSVMREFFLSRCGDPKAWEIAAADNELIQDKKTIDRLKELVTASNAEDMTLEAIDELWKEYSVLNEHGLSVMKWTFKTTVIDDAEEFLGIVYTNKHNKIIHTFALSTVQ